MNLGEEYLPSKFFFLPRTDEDFTIYLSIKLTELLFTKLQRKKSTLEKQKENWNSIPVWIEASDLGWTGALIYSKLWEAFERAELWLFQFEGIEVAILKNLMS
ncbi:unnamed protein product [Prunus armeniaca]